MNPEKRPWSAQKFLPEFLSYFIEEKENLETCCRSVEFLIDTTADHRSGRFYVGSRKWCEEKGDLAFRHDHVNSEVFSTFKYFSRPVFTCEE